LIGKTCSSTAATSKTNGLLSQKSCHYLNHGRRSNDMLMRAAHRLAHFDFSETNVACANVLKAFES